jgi:hypothetical protein
VGEYNSLVAPGSDFTLTAVAGHPSGVFDRVQFFANGRLLGAGSLSGQSIYSFNWKALGRGNYSISVNAIDGAGIPVSTPVKFYVDKSPEIAIISPADSSHFSLVTNLSIVARATQVDGSIKRVDFYANGRLIGSASDIAAGIIRFTWKNVPNGQVTLKAVAVDDLGVSATSKTIIVRVEKP